MRERLFERFRLLDRYGLLSNTNKASVFTTPSGEVARHYGLLKHYEFFLREYRDEWPFPMLELGAGNAPDVGASMRCWQRYFSDTTNLHVADIKPEARDLEKEGFHVHIGDLGNQEFLDELASHTWGFVIDDASHLWGHQVAAFRTLFPAVKQGGIFIMEDLCTSYGNWRDGYHAGETYDAVAYFQALSRIACGGTWEEDGASYRATYPIAVRDYEIAQSIDLVAWVANSCVIVKA